MFIPEDAAKTAAKCPTVEFTFDHVFQAWKILFQSN